MITPVHDPQWRDWDGNVVRIEDGFKDYKADAFADYLSRGWCRLEMFFNANIPFDSSRSRLFGGELARVMREEKRRPHLVFGTREMEKGPDEMPLILPKLRDSEFARLDPRTGDLTSKKDAFVIGEYVEELFQFNSGLAQANAAAEDTTKPVLSRDQALAAAKAKGLFKQHIEEKSGVSAVPGPRAVWARFNRQ